VASELQGSVQRSFVFYERQLLALSSMAGKLVTTALTATDLQNSVLLAVQARQRLGCVYAPYGHRPVTGAVPGLPGFNGEQPDPVTGHYPLGNGYRAYNPVLMRFNSPDSLSPFGKGGLNAYAYCLGDPINRVDPTGHLSWQAGIGLGLSALGMVSSVMTLGAATPLAIAGLAAGLASGTVGVAQAVTEESSPETSSVLGWVGLGLGVASAGSGFAAGFQKVGNKVAGRFGAGLSGKGAGAFGQRNKSSSFRSMQPVLSDMPPHIKEHIISYLPGKDAATLGQVSSDLLSATMATSRARFVAHKYAELPYQEWLGKLDNIYFGEINGIAPMFLKRNGINFSDIRAGLIRSPRVLGYRFKIFPRTLNYGPVEQVDPRVLAMQLHAAAGGGF
jgi:RHS repeat-associated protein